MRKQGKIFLFIGILAVLLCVLALSTLASDVVSENYVETEDAYTVYTDAQYTEVITGIYEGTISNKKIVFGCSIDTVTDFVMSKPCDITIDLNGFTYRNYKVYNKSGDFDFQHSDAILRISNGYIDSSFCVFIFRTTGQLYAENITVSSNDECIYHYGSGHSAVVSLKNCNMDARGNYSAVSIGGNCGGGDNGSLYMIDGGEYGGLNIFCALEGSYVRNCRIYEKRLTIDSWHQHGGDNNQDVTIEIRNTIIEVEIYLNDQVIDPVLYDCTFPKVNLSNKTNATIVSYTSPTCTKPGTKTTYHHLTEVTVDEQYSVDNPALGHTLDLENPEDIIYTSFMENGKHVTSCKVCSVAGLTEEDGTAEPLFSSEGYSVPEDGEGELVIAFHVNNKAIERYESVTKKSLSYGIFAIAQKNLTSDNVINEDGSAINGAIKAEIAREFASVELRILGFVTDTQKSAKLALGAYICEEKNDEAKYSFIQYGTPLENEKYSFISYNALIEAIAKE